MTQWLFKSYHTHIITCWVLWKCIHGSMGQCGSLWEVARSDQQDQWHVWAVGWITSISELCEICICNTHTWGIRFWSHYMAWPSSHVVGHGLGYKHQWIVCDVSAIHIHGGFGSGVTTSWLGKALHLSFQHLNDSMNPEMMVHSPCSVLVPWECVHGGVGAVREVARSKIQQRQCPPHMGCR